MTCPNCLESAKFVDYRQTTLTSLFGDVVYERVYSHCPHCHQGHFPTDQELGVRTRKTKAAAEVMTLSGTVAPFRQSAKRL